MHLGSAPFNRPVPALGSDSHDGEHAGCDGCGQKVGGGERFTLSGVVDRSIGDQHGSGAMVCGLTAKFTAIQTGNSGHDVLQGGWFNLAAQFVNGCSLILCSQEIHVLATHGDVVVLSVEVPHL